jgi:hypothetical protein
MQREDRPERVDLVPLRVGDVDPDEATVLVEQPFGVAEAEVALQGLPVPEGVHLDHQAERTRDPW